MMIGHNDTEVASVKKRRSSRTSVDDHKARLGKQGTALGVINHLIICQQR